MLDNQLKAVLGLCVCTTRFIIIGPVLVSFTVFIHCIFDLKQDTAELLVARKKILSKELAERVLQFDSLGLLPLL